MALTPVEPADLTGKIDQFLIECLKKRHDLPRCLTVQPRLTWNRFDLAFKLGYLRALGTWSEAFATRLYDAHILALSLGRAEEPGNAEKVGLDRFRADFRAIFESLRQNGFDPARSLVPLARDGSPMNGAHRITAAMALGLDVAAVETGLEPMIFDQRFFRSRGVPEPFMTAAALVAAEAVPDTVVTVTAGTRRSTPPERPFYSKTVTLTPQGFQNLDVQLDAEDVDRLADDLGNNAQVGLRVDLWASRDEARRGAARAIFTSRTPKGTLELARLLFNPNSVHLLQNAVLCADDKVWRLAREAATGRHGDFAFDMDMVLAAYGIRDPRQVEYRSAGVPPEGLVAERCVIPHAEADSEIIADPRHHFYAFGHRFVALRLVADTLERQNDRCERDDLVAANRLRECEPSSVDAPNKSRLRYHRVREALIAIAFRLGLGEPLRRIYRQLRR